MWSCRFCPRPADRAPRGCPAAAGRAGPDARQHQQLRRLQRARAQQHFAAGLQRAACPALLQFDANGAAAVHQHAGHLGLGHHLQVGPLAVGREVGLRCTETFTALVRDLVGADAFLRGAVEVRVQRVAGLLRRLNEHRAEPVGAAQVHHVQRPARGVPGIGPALVVLRFQEVRQHVAPAPARVALGRPMVVVGVLATQVDHGVDGAGTAQHPPARLVALAAVEPRLRHRLEAPVGLAGAGHQGQSGRAVDEGAAVLGACLQQAHAHVRVFAQARRQHAAGRTTADDQIVKHFPGSPVGCGESRLKGQV
jgi:hypothetical protein